MWTREPGDWFPRWQTVVETNRQPPSPLAHPQFLLFSPFWSHQWCSHRGAWHQRQRCTHCTEVEPASYFALPIALHWANMHRVLFKITLHQRRATPVQAQCTNRQLGFTQILSLLQNEHCNGTGWARSYKGPSATFSEEADCTAVQLDFIQCPFPNQIQFGLEKLHPKIAYNFPNQFQFGLERKKMILQDADSKPNSDWFGKFWWSLSMSWKFQTNFSLVWKNHWLL